MPSYTFSIKYGLPLANEHFTAIGEVAATWQYLELAVQVAIWATLGLDPERGKLATASLRFDTHLDIMALIALDVTQSEPNPIDVHELIRSTKELRDERNTIVHAIWTFSPLRVGDPIGLIQPAAWKLKMKDAKNPPQRFTPEQIRAVAERINETRLKWAEYGTARRASRQTPVTQNLPQTAPPN